jgi:hypothetical protein
MRCDQSHKNRLLALALARRFLLVPFAQRFERGVTAWGAPTAPHSWRATTGNAQADRTCRKDWNSKASQETTVAEA